MMDYGMMDYSSEKDDNSHYCVPSMYGKLCKEQYNEQPMYSWPGEAGGSMQGAKRNEQTGP